MKTPYDRLFTSEHDDDDTDSDSSFPARKPTKPLPVNDSIINFSLNKQKELPQSAAEMLRAELEAASPTNEYKGDEDDEDEEDSDSATTKPRRRGAARSIRAMLKRRRRTRLQTASAEPAAAAGIATSEIAAATPVAAEETKESAVSTEAAVRPSEVEVFLHGTDSASPDLEENPAVPLRSEADPATEPTLNSLRVATATLPPPTPPPLNIAALPAAFTAAQTAANAVPAAATAGATAAANLNQAPAMVVERRNNLAGPFIAFLAANYLSKRRDRKIRREAKKTNKELQATQTRLRNESQRTGRLEESVATVKRQSPAPKPDVPLPPRPNIPTRVGEVLAATDRLSRTETAERTEQSKQSVSSSPAESAQSKQIKLAPATEALLRSQSTRQESQEFIKESDFDRRHEVKDAPAAGHGPVVQSITTGKTQSDATTQQATVATTDQPLAPPSTIGHPSPVPAPGTDLYKQAIRTGMIAGLTVAILGFTTLIVL